MAARVPIEAGDFGETQRNSGEGEHAMDIATTVTLIALGLVLLLGFGLFGLVSIREGEGRAARVALGAAVFTSLPFFLASLLPVAVKLVILGVVAVAVGGGIVLFLLPIGRIERGNDVPRQRFDERDIMFARARLVPDSLEYEAYYAMRPENRASDDQTRTLPGLLSLTASKANPLAFASAEVQFLPDRGTAGRGGWPGGPRRLEVLRPRQMTPFIKSLARYYGAYTVGITALQPYHVYSHIGRGKRRVRRSHHPRPSLRHRLHCGDGSRHDGAGSGRASGDGIGAAVRRGGQGSRCNWATSSAGWAIRLVRILMATIASSPRWWLATPAWARSVGWGC